MHSLFALLFSALLSFCHHSSAARAPEASFASDSFRPTPVLSFSTHNDMTRANPLSSYAGAECLSCRTTTVSFIVR